MKIFPEQTTLAAGFEIEGIGLHKGLPVKMRIEPAAADAGVVFDLNGEKILADHAHAVVSARNTTIASGSGAQIHTVEHILSAFYGMGVDNATVYLDSEEPPALDGSAGPIAAAIAEAGITRLDKPARTLNLREPFVIGEKGALVFFLPAPAFKATYILDYQHPMIGTQAADFEQVISDYAAEVANARTFGMIEEVDALKNAGLALGGSVENAVVIYPDRYSSDLRFKNEFARHKLLDLIGDVSLIGARLNAHCLGVRSGHALNIKAIRGVLAEAII